MKQLLPVLALAAASAHAQLITAPVLMVATPPNGAIIQLHDIAGPCVGPAKLATWVAPGGKEKLNGCFKVDADSGVVSIAWFDGDGSSVSVRAFRVPEEI